MLIFNSGIASEPGTTPLFDIPRLDNIVIDGKADDWGDHGFRVDAMATMDGQVPPASDFDCRFRLGWNDQGLIVIVTVHANSFVENDFTDSLWQNDSVELYMADKRGGKELVQAVIAPGMDAKHPELRYDMIDHRHDEAPKKTAPSLTAARTRIDGGYIMEILLPWKNIGVQPGQGMELGFQCFVNRFDPETKRQSSLLWYPAIGIFVDTLRTHRLHLVDKAGSPVKAVGRGFYDGMKCTKGIIVGTEDMAGRPVSMQTEGNVIASGIMAGFAGRSVANLNGPVPLDGVGWKSLDLLVDGHVVDTISLPDIQEVRQKALLKTQYVFRPPCFEGSQFPKGDFQDPAEAGNIFGSSTIDVTYYDAGFNPVKTADKPGRYGAIVKIHSGNGDVTRKYCALFRLPEKTAWPLGIGGGSPPSREQEKTLQGYVKGRSEDDFFHSADSAVIMAWLQETPPETLTTRRNDPWSNNDRWIHELKRKTGNATPLDYRVYLPDGAADTGGKKWPAILHLHGSGGQEMSMDHLANAEPVKYAKAHKDFPFIIITPHCPPGEKWQPSALDDLYDEVMVKYPVDQDRVYLTGESLGGYGTWMYAVEHPGRFAAAVPVCGFDDPREAGRLKDLPVWNFHGAKDPAVPIEKSCEMIAALRKAGGRVRFTVYSDGRHTIWDEVYNTDELYQWLLQQVRGKPAQPRDGVRGPEPSDRRPIKNRE